MDLEVCKACLLAQNLVEKTEWGHWRLNPRYQTLRLKYSTHWNIQIEDPTPRNSLLQFLADSIYHCSLCKYSVLSSILKDKKKSGANSHMDKVKLPQRQTVQFSKWQRKPILFIHIFANFSPLIFEFLRILNTPRSYSQWECILL